MTNSETLAAIATEIESLGADLLKVNSTIDLIGKPAIDAANKLDRALKDAKERFATALADEQVEARNLRLARFSDIRVEVRPGESLIDTAFSIHYMQDAWDMSVNATIPKPHSCNGFAALADDAYEYLVTKKPEAIPAEIMALAPGKPQEAFAIYLQGKARGFFKGAVAA
ncbi:hypothetical protein SAMN05192583_1917 [Sphingomonas gellani]|uniref:Uncharacterized protein n=1 Tax=Sphingomonas gellani TaxID=1166340 RepID=A0A1H8DG61_9SPHN|nr:hypothetical protein [Sphingomonas gellani]SEN06282.1 hypothetical protein SAMN05192583_1917 [Sphingomonas gellani]